MPKGLVGAATRDPNKPTLKDGTRQYIKPGGIAQANKDFDSLNPQGVQSPSIGVRVGTLADGTHVVVRPESVPSLEIDPPSGPALVIRYKSGDRSA